MHQEFERPSNTSSPVLPLGLPLDGAALEHWLTEARRFAAEAGPLGGGLARWLSGQQLAQEMAQHQWQTFLSLAALSFQPARQMALMVESMEMQVALQHRLGGLFENWVAGLGHISQSAWAAQRTTTLGGLVEADMNALREMNSLWVDQMMALARLGQNVQKGVDLMLERYQPTPPAG
jgi:hypothetical protein